MNRFLLFEAGSTKTTLTVLRAGNALDQAETFFLSGYNPNRPHTSFFDEIDFLDLDKEDQVVFYGSGLGSKKNREKVKAYFFSNGIQEVEVEDDLLAAGRGLYGKAEGVFAILGTGAVAGFYDGEKVLERRGGYGYLINDYGGGYELGKFLVSAWLNEAFSEEINQTFESFFDTQRDDFTTVYYQDYKSNPKDSLGKMAAVPKLIQPFRNNGDVQSILFGYFQFAFEQHILPLSQKFRSAQIGLVGSIAHHFQDEIEMVAVKCCLKTYKIIQFPATGLLDYHKKM